MKVTWKVGDIEFVVEVASVKELEDVVKVIGKPEEEKTPSVHKNTILWPMIDWPKGDPILPWLHEGYRASADGRLPGQPQPFFKYP